MYNYKTINGESVTIADIESMTEEMAQNCAEEHLRIKDHDVYLIDFGGHFGYSACVFCNGHHIHYANDYELHHKGHDNKWLRDWYVETLNNKLFTEEELKEPIKSYSDYTRKDYFLRNYYPMREDYISAFRIATTEKEDKAFEKSVQDMFYNPISFSYFKDKEFVKHCIDLHVALSKAKDDTLDNYEYWVDAIYSEMCNHEYGINWQRDFDTLSAFGNPNWYGDDYDSNLNKMFDDVGFNDMQRKAYFAAKAKYYDMAEENEWF